MIIINKRPYYPSKRVDFYASRVLKELEIKEPPVLYGSILEYFGIELDWITPEDEEEFERRSHKKIEIPAILIHRNNKPTVFVRKSDMRERRRLSIFHECGHFDIPWHCQNDYACDCSDVVTIHKQTDEKEAFEYARSIMFPPALFYEDIRNLPVSLETVELLAKRYRASFAATANNYVTFVPAQCAIIYLQLNPEADATGCPFMVNYSIKSKTHEFHRYWRKGELISHHGILENCFHYKERLTGEIPAIVFGSSKTHVYISEVRPYGNDQICVFLKIPNRQIRIF